MSKHDDLVGLFEKLLRFRDHAVVRHEQRGVTLFEAKHDGLTLWFYDARNEATPGIPPLGVEVYEGEQTPGQFKHMFRGYVDPENVAHADFTKWKRGSWEEAL